MQFRVARHTNNLQRIKSFYIAVLNFELLGSFENHNNYDGIFLGFKEADWHLEFTISNEKTNHNFDEDDILVLYPETLEEYNSILEKILENNISFIKSKNPYWKENGKMILDPDGYRIIISPLKIKE